MKKGSEKVKARSKVVGTIGGQLANETGFRVGVKTPDWSGIMGGISLKPVGFG
jgi:hypothetical protein